MKGSDWVTCSGSGQCKAIDENDMSKGKLCHCNEGYAGSDCSTDISKVFQLKELLTVRLVWGIGKRSSVFAGLWNKNSDSAYSFGIDKPAIGFDDIAFQTSCDLSDPEVQLWMLETAKAARNRTDLHISPRRRTWIEIVEDEVEKTTIFKQVNSVFPLQKSDFTGVISLLMEDSNFRKQYGSDIGTTGPGVGGEFVLRH